MKKIKEDIHIDVRYKFSKDKKSFTFKVKSEEIITDDDIKFAINYVLSLDNSGGLAGMDEQSSIN